VVWFNGDVAENMPWEFKPTQQCVKVPVITSLFIYILSHVLGDLIMPFSTMQVRPGQSTLVFFTAKNKS